MLSEGSIKFAKLFLAIALLFVFINQSIILWSNFIDQKTLMSISEKIDENAFVS